MFTSHDLFVAFVLFYAVSISVLLVRANAYR